MFSNQISNETQKTNSDWLLLISSILKIEDPKQLDLEITETKTKVILTTNSKDIASRLNVVLQSPSTIYSSLKYEIKHENSSLPEPSVFEETYPPLPEMKNLLEFKTFENIFSTELKKAIGMQWDSEIRKDDTYVLCFQVKTGFEKLTREQMELYRNCLAAATFSELRKALTQESEHTPLRMPSSKQDSSLSVLSKHVDKILYVTKDELGNSIACFDIGLLCYCVTPPKLEAEPVENGKTEETEEATKFTIEIDKNHFISYLSTVLQEGFVLHTVQSSELTGKQLAFPICFNMARTVPLENVISFVLDKSSSMGNCFKKYIKEVKAFILELQEQSKLGKDFLNTTIRIRPFSDKSDEVKEFSLQKGSKAIIEYLCTLKAEGQTYLNGTVADELDALRSDIRNKNVTLVVFTDGEDNVNSENSLKRLGEIKIELSKLGAPPKVFTFGLGESYSEEGMRKLSDISGSEHTRLNIISEFKRGLSSHLDSYCKVVRLAKFVQDQVEEQGEEQEQKHKKITFNVRIKEGQVVQADQALVLPGNFSVNDENYTVTDVPMPNLENSVHDIPMQNLSQTLEKTQEALNKSSDMEPEDKIPPVLDSPPNPPVIHQYNNEKNSEQKEKLEPEKKKWECTLV